MHGQEDGETGAEARTRKASNRIPEGALGRTLRCAPGYLLVSEKFPVRPRLAQPAETKREIVK